MPGDVADQRRPPQGDRSARHGLVGRSAAIREIRRAIDLVAPSDTPVLITGEAGTGKELVAKAIHAASGSFGRFVAVNCAAMPQELAESTLFGHVEGAFTGAAAEEPGAFGTAQGGTLLLDEIGLLPVSAQGKLLRALDPGEFSPVGSAEGRRVTARIIAATNRPVMPQSDGTGSLRGDLHSRLSGFRIHLPPLRERPGDVSLLIDHFVQAVPVGPEAREVLEAYDWSQGNVRALRNALARAEALAAGGEIRPEHLVEQNVIRGGIPNPDTRGSTRPSLLLDDVKRRHVLRVLDSVGGNRSAAARLLGIDRKTVRNMLRRWNEEDRLAGDLKPGRDRVDGVPQGCG